MPLPKGYSKYKTEEEKKEAQRIRRKLWAENNKERNSKTNKEWKENNKDKLRQMKRKATIAKYGLSVEEYDKMLEEQNHCCYLCKKHKTSFTKELFIDHNHNTGKVRKLLCSLCNTAIGMIEINNLSISDIEKYLTEVK